jgi:hypothetical protein
VTFGRRIKLGHGVEIESAGSVQQGRNFTCGKFAKPIFIHIFVVLEYGFL